MEKQKDIGFVKLRDFNNALKLFKNSQLYYKPEAKGAKEGNPDRWDEILAKVSNCYIHDMSQKVKVVFGAKGSVASASRRRELVEARYALYFFLSNRWDVNTIANRFNRDRTTVLLGLKIVRERFKYDKDYVDKLDKIATQFYNPFNL